MLGTSALEFAENGATLHIVWAFLSCRDIFGGFCGAGFGFWACKGAPEPLPDFVGVGLLLGALEDGGFGDCLGLAAIDLAGLGLLAEDGLGVVVRGLKP